MKIAKLESLHADGGMSVFSFLKVTTDEGIVGWSEYNEFMNPGVASVIEHLAPVVIGADPLATDALSAGLYAKTRLTTGGISAQAIAAIENAVFDIKGKALNVPCYQLLGGPIRTRLPVYWSHCGTYRMNPATAAMINKPQIKHVEQLQDLAAEVKESGFKAFKTNILLFGEDGNVHAPCFASSVDVPGAPELNAETPLLKAVTSQMTQLRKGAGDDVDILLDLNFNFKTEGYLKVIRTLEPFNLFWYEIDMFNPTALAYIRQQANLPVASCESLYGIREFRPYFEQQSMDVAIIDVPWNGIWQSYKIATMADAHEVNVAGHNFNGHLYTMINAHLCAAIPNFRILEMDVDAVPWRDDLVTYPAQIEDGELVLSDRPGWGMDINEEAVHAHPPRPDNNLQAVLMQPERR